MDKGPVVVFVGSTFSAPQAVCAEHAQGREVIARAVSQLRQASHPVKQWGFILLIGSPQTKGAHFSFFGSTGVLNLGPHTYKAGTRTAWATPPAGTNFSADT
jgi:hypothetical protein